MMFLNQFLLLRDANAVWSWPELLDDPTSWQVVNTSRDNSGPLNHFGIALGHCSACGMSSNES